MNDDNSQSLYERVEQARRDLAEIVGQVQEMASADFLQYRRPEFTALVVLAHEYRARSLDQEFCRESKITEYIS